MVERITIFEPHIEGAQFGPTTFPFDKNDGGETDSTGGAETEEGASKSRLVTVIQGLAVFVVMFVVLYWVFSRMGAESE